MALFTWMLIDIDAPDPEDPSHAPFLHYIVTNLDASNSRQPVVTQQQVVVPYYPVTPPKGEHRYVSLLFHQQALYSRSPANQQEPDEQLSAQRSNFDVAAYAADHMLELASTSHFYSQPKKEDDEENDHD